jgi:hypothetical protein
MRRLREQVNGSDLTRSQTSVLGRLLRRFGNGNDRRFTALGSTAHSGLDWVSPSGVPQGWAVFNTNSLIAGL